MTISFSGPSSGIDTTAWVDALVKMKQASVTSLEAKKEVLVQTTSILDNVKSFFASFKSVITNVTQSNLGIASFDLFIQNLVETTNADIATASVTTEAQEANYEVYVNQVATETEAKSAFLTNIVSTTQDIATHNSLLSSIGIGTGEVGFNVGGVERRITLQSNDTIGSFIDKLNKIGVDASYDPTLGLFSINIGIEDINDDIDGDGIDNTGIKEALFLQDVNSGYSSDILNLVDLNTFVVNATSAATMSLFGITEGEYTIVDKDGNETIFSADVNGSFQSFFDAIERFGLHATFNEEGEITIETTDGYLIKGALAEQLGIVIDDQSHETDTKAASTIGVFSTEVMNADFTSTLEEIGAITSDSDTLQILDKNNNIIAEITTLTSNSTVDDLFTVLAEHGIAGSLQNSVITLESMTERIVGGKIAENMGIETYHSSTTTIKTGDTTTSTTMISYLASATDWVSDCLWDVWDSYSDADKVLTVTHRDRDKDYEGNVNIQTYTYTVVAKNSIGADGSVLKGTQFQDIADWYHSIDPTSTFVFNDNGQIYIDSDDCFYFEGKIAEYLGIGGYSVTYTWTEGVTTTSSSDTVSYRVRKTDYIADTLWDNGWQNYSAADKVISAYSLTVDHTAGINSVNNPEYGGTGNHAEGNYVETNATYQHTIQTLIGTFTIKEGQTTYEDLAYWYTHVIDQTAAFTINNDGTISIDSNDTVHLEGKAITDLGLGISTYHQSWTTGLEETQSTGSVTYAVKMTDYISDTYTAEEWATVNKRISVYTSYIDHDASDGSSQVTIQTKLTDIIIDEGTTFNDLRDQLAPYQIQLGMNDGVIQFDSGVTNYLVEEPFCSFNVVNGVTYMTEGTSSSGLTQMLVHFGVRYDTVTQSWTTGTAATESTAVVQYAAKLSDYMSDTFTATEWANLSNYKDSAGNTHGGKEIAVMHSYVNHDTQKTIIETKTVITINTETTFQDLKDLLYHLGDSDDRNRIMFDINNGIITLDSNCMWIEGRIADHYGIKVDSQTMSWTTGTAATQSTGTVKYNSSMTDYISDTFTANQWASTNKVLTIKHSELNHANQTTNITNAATVTITNETTFQSLANSLAVWGITLNVTNGVLTLNSSPVSGQNNSTYYVEGEVMSHFGTKYDTVTQTWTAGTAATSSTATVTYNVKLTDYISDTFTSTTNTNYHNIDNTSWQNVNKTLTIRYSYLDHATHQTVTVAATTTTITDQTTFQNLKDTLAKYNITLGIDNGKVTMSSTVKDGRIYYVTGAIMDHYGVNAMTYGTVSQSWTYGTNTTSSAYSYVACGTDYISDAMTLNTWNGKNKNIVVYETSLNHSTHKTVITAKTTLTVTDTWTFNDLATKLGQNGITMTMSNGAIQLDSNLVWAEGEILTYFGGTYNTVTQNWTTGTEATVSSAAILYNSDKGTGASNGDYIRNLYTGNGWTNENKVMTVKDMTYNKATHKVETVTATFTVGADWTIKDLADKLATYGITLNVANGVVTMDSDRAGKWVEGNIATKMGMSYKASTLTHTIGQAVTSTSAVTHMADMHDYISSTYTGSDNKLVVYDQTYNRTNNTTSNRVKGTITIGATWTFQDLANALAGYGITFNISGGKVTMDSSSDACWVTGGLATHLGMTYKTSTLTETYGTATTSSSNVTYSIKESDTVYEMLQSSWNSLGKVMTIYRSTIDVSGTNSTANSVAVSTYTVGTNTTFGDLKTWLTNNGVTMTLTNGVIALSSTTDRYVTGDIATALGMTTQNSPDRAYTIAVTQTGTAGLTYTAHMDDYIVDTIANMNGKTVNVIQQTLVNGTVTTSTVGTVYTIGANTTFQNVADYLSGKGITMTCNNGVFTCVGSGEKYVAGDFANAMGFGTTTGSTEYWTYGITATSNSLIGDAQMTSRLSEVLMASNTSVSDSNVYVVQQRYKISPSSGLAYVTVATIATNGSTTYSNLASAVSSYVTLSVSNGNVSVTSGDYMLTGEMAGAIGVGISTGTGATKTVTCSKSLTGATLTATAQLSSKLTDFGLSAGTRFGVNQYHPVKDSTTNIGTTMTTSATTTFGDVINYMNSTSGGNINAYMSNGKLCYTYQNGYYVQMNGRRQWENATDYMYNSVVITTSCALTTSGSLTYTTTTVTTTKTQGTEYMTTMGSEQYGLYIPTAGTYNPEFILYKVNESTGDLEAEMMWSPDNYVLDTSNYNTQLINDLNSCFCPSYYSSHASFETNWGTPLAYVDQGYVLAYRWNRNGYDWHYINQVTSYTTTVTVTQTVTTTRTLSELNWSGCNIRVSDLNQCTNKNGKDVIKLKKVSDDNNGGIITEYATVTLSASETLAEWYTKMGAYGISNGLNSGNGTYGFSRSMSSSDYTTGWMIEAQTGNGHTGTGLFSTTYGHWTGINNKTTTTYYKKNGTSTATSTKTYTKTADADTTLYELYSNNPESHIGKFVDITYANPGPSVIYADQVTETRSATISSSMTIREVMQAIAQANPGWVTMSINNGKITLGGTSYGGYISDIDSTWANLLGFNIIGGASAFQDKSTYRLDKNTGTNGVRAGATTASTLSQIGYNSVTVTSNVHTNSQHGSYNSATNITWSSNETMETFLQKLRNAGYTATYDTSTGKISVTGDYNHYLTIGTNTLGFSSTNNRYTYAYQVQNATSGAKTTSIKKHTGDTLTGRTYLSEFGINSAQTITVKQHNSTTGVFDTKTVTWNTNETIDSLITKLANVGITASMNNNGVVTFSGSNKAYITDMSASLKNIFHVSTGEDKTYDSKTMKLTTANANNNVRTCTISALTTLADLGLGNANRSIVFTCHNDDAFMHNFTSSHGDSVAAGMEYVTVTWTTTENLQSFMNKLNACKAATTYGASFGLSNGKITFTGNYNTYISSFDSGLATALKASATPYTSRTYTIVDEAHSDKTGVAVRINTDKTKLSDLGISSNQTVSFICHKDSEYMHDYTTSHGDTNANTNETVTVTWTTSQTLGEFVAALNASKIKTTYGGTFSANNTNGTVTFTGGNNCYMSDISASLKTALKLTGAAYTTSSYTIVDEAHSDKTDLKTYINGNTRLGDLGINANQTMTIVTHLDNNYVANSHIGSTCTKTETVTWTTAETLDSFISKLSAKGISAQVTSDSKFQFTGNENIYVSGASSALATALKISTKENNTYGKSYGYTMVYRNNADNNAEYTYYNERNTKLANMGLTSAQSLTFVVHANTTFAQDTTNASNCTFSTTITWATNETLAAFEQKCKNALNGTLAQGDLSFSVDKNTGKWTVQTGEWCYLSGVSSGLASKTGLAAKSTSYNYTVINSDKADTVAEQTYLNARNTKLHNFGINSDQNVVFVVHTNNTYAQDYTDSIVTTVQNNGTVSTQNVNRASNTTRLITVKWTTTDTLASFTTKVNTTLASAYNAYGAPNNTGNYAVNFSVDPNTGKLTFQGNEYTYIKSIDSSLENALLVSGAKQSNGTYGKSYNYTINYRADADRNVDYTYTNERNTKLSNMSITSAQTMDIVFHVNNTFAVDNTDPSSAAHDSRSKISNVTKTITVTWSAGQTLEQFENSVNQLLYNNWLTYGKPNNVADLKNSAYSDLQAKQGNSVYYQDQSYINNALNTFNGGNDGRYYIKFEVDPNTGKWKITGDENTYVNRIDSSLENFMKLTGDKKENGTYGKSYSYNIKYRADADTNKDYTYVNERNTMLHNMSINQDQTMTFVVHGNNTFAQNNTDGMTAIDHVTHTITVTWTSSQTLEQFENAVNTQLYNLWLSYGKPNNIHDYTNDALSDLQAKQGNSIYYHDQSYINNTLNTFEGGVNDGRYYIKFEVDKETGKWKITGDEFTYLKDVSDPLENFMKLTGDAKEGGTYGESYGYTIIYRADADASQDHTYLNERNTTLANLSINQSQSMDIVIHINNTYAQDNTKSTIGQENRSSNNTVYATTTAGKTQTSSSAITYNKNYMATEANTFGQIGINNPGVTSVYDSTGTKVGEFTLTSESTIHSFINAINVANPSANAKIEDGIISIERGYITGNAATALGLNSIFNGYETLAKAQTSATSVTYDQLVNITTDTTMEQLNMNTNDAVEVYNSDGTQVGSFTLQSYSTVGDFLASINAANTSANAKIEDGKISITEGYITGTIATAFGLNQTTGTPQECTIGLSQTSSTGVEFYTPTTANASSTFASLQIDTTDEVIVYDTDGVRAGSFSLTATSTLSDFVNAINTVYSSANASINGNVITIEKGYIGGSVAAALGLRQNIVSSIDTTVGISKTSTNSILYTINGTETTATGDTKLSDLGLDSSYSIEFHNVRTDSYEGIEVTTDMSISDIISSLEAATNSAITGSIKDGKLTLKGNADFYIEYMSLSLMYALDFMYGNGNTYNVQTVYKYGDSSSDEINAYEKHYLSETTTAAELGINYSGFSNGHEEYIFNDDDLVLQTFRNANLSASVDTNGKLTIGGDQDYYITYMTGSMIDILKIGNIGESYSFRNVLVDTYGSTDSTLTKVNAPGNMTESTKLSDLGLSSATFTIGNGTDLTTYTISSTQNIVSALRDRGLNVSVADGKITIQGSGNKYLYSMSDNLKDALNIGAGEGYSYIVSDANAYNSTSSSALTANVFRSIGNDTTLADLGLNNATITTNKGLFNLGANDNIVAKLESLGLGVSIVNGKISISGDKNVYLKAMSSGLKNALKVDAGENISWEKFVDTTINAGIIHDVTRTITVTWTCGALGTEDEEVKPETLGEYLADINASLAQATTQYKDMFNLSEDFTISAYVDGDGKFHFTGDEYTYISRIDTDLANALKVASVTKEGNTYGRSYQYDVQYANNSNNVTQFTYVNYDNMRLQNFDVRQDQYITIVTNNNTTFSADTTKNGTVLFDHTSSTYVITWTVGSTGHTLNGNSYNNNDNAIRDGETFEELKYELEHFGVLNNLATEASAVLGNDIYKINVTINPDRTISLVGNEYTYILGISDTLQDIFKIQNREGEGYYYSKYDYDVHFNNDGYTDTVNTTLLNYDTRLDNLSIMADMTMTIETPEGGKSIILDQDTTLQEIKERLFNDFGIDLTIEDKTGRVTFTPTLANEGYYILGMDSELKNALKIVTGEKGEYTIESEQIVATNKAGVYTTTVKNVTTTLGTYGTSTIDNYDNTASRNLRFEDDNNILKMDTRISRINGYNNGNGNITVHYADGLEQNISIRESMSVGQLCEILQDYGVTTEILSGGRVTFKSNDGTYVKSAEGGSNLLEVLNMSNVSIKVEGTTVISSKTLHNTVVESSTYFATEDTLLSTYAEGLIETNGVITFALNDKYKSVTVTSDDTFGTLINKFKEKGLNAKIEAGKFSVSSGFDTFSIIQEATTSNLAAAILLNRDENLGGYAMTDRSKTIISTTTLTDTKSLSIVNYADKDTTLGTFNIIGGTLSVYKDGKKAGVEISAVDTISTLQDKIRGALGQDINGEDDTNLTIKFEDGYLKIYQKDANIIVGSNEDTSNFGAITGISTNKGVAESTRQFYKVNEYSKVTEEGLFRNGNITAGDFVVGNATITIDETTTINELVSQINTNPDSNVTAYWDSIRGEFKIVSNSTGDFYINFESGSSNFTDVLGFTKTSVDNETGVTKSNINVTSQKTGKNARVTINGATYTSVSNTIGSDITGLKGLTINVKGMSAGEATILSVKKDVQSLALAISDVIEAYNALIDNINSALSSKSELKNDNELKRLRNQIKSILTGTNKNSSIFKNILAIGIVTDAADPTNLTTGSGIFKLALDYEKFAKAFEADSESVRRLLIGRVDEDGELVEEGVLTRLEALIDEAMDSAGGYFERTEETFDRQIERIDNKIVKGNAAIEKYRERLEKKYMSMNILNSNIQTQYQVYFK